MIFEWCNVPCAFLEGILCTKILKNYSKYKINSKTKRREIGSATTFPCWFKVPEINRAFLIGLLKKIVQLGSHSAMLGLDCQIIPRKVPIMLADNFSNVPPKQSWNFSKMLLKVSNNIYEINQNVPKIFSIIFLCCFITKFFEKLSSKNWYYKFFFDFSKTNLLFTFFNNLSEFSYNNFRNFPNFLKISSGWEVIFLKFTGFQKLLGSYPQFFKNHFNCNAVLGSEAPQNKFSKAPQIFLKFLRNYSAILL